LFVREVGGAPTVLANPDVAGAVFSLRLDRDLGNNEVRGYYSLDGANWTFLAQAAHSFTNARLALWMGAATVPYATTQYACDLSRLDVITTNNSPQFQYSLAVTNAADQSVVTNAVISAAGVIGWTPTELQGPGVYLFRTAVTDGTYQAQNSFTV